MLPFNPYNSSITPFQLNPICLSESRGSDNVVLAGERRRGGRAEVRGEKKEKSVYAFFCCSFWDHGASLWVFA